MQTFFTEIDAPSEKKLLKDINRLSMRLNLDSPRTQAAMRKVGVNRSQCTLKYGPLLFEDISSIR